MKNEREISGGAASNTALRSQTQGLSTMAAKIDWLTLCFDISGKARLDKLIHDIQEMLQGSIFFDNYRIKDDHSGRYQTFSGSLGITFGYTSFDNDNICYARLTLPGQFLEQRKPWHIKRVMRRLHHDYKARCSRIDLAVDDYERQLEHKEIESAIKKKQGIGFNCGKTIDSYGTVNAGVTVYAGTRRSPKFARFYEKQGFDRFEIEYKQGLASSIFSDYLADSTPDSCYLLSSILRSSISFAWKRDKNLSRSHELGWWVAFRDRIVGTKIKVTTPKPMPSLHSTFKWIHKSVSKSLLLMRQALGEEIMNETIELWQYEARKRCNSFDNDRLLQFNKQGFSADDLINMLQFS